MARSDLDFKRLRNAIDWSVDQLADARRERVDAVRQYVGSHYSRNGSAKRVPVNMLELATTIYVGQLAARAPQVMVTAAADELKPFAKSMQIALNQIPDEIGLAATLRRAVVEAIFGVGVVKVGIASGGSRSLGHDVGETFVDVVSLDDYFLDMSAKSRGVIQFEGNDYWLDIEAARDMFDGQGSEIEPDEHTIHGDKGEARAEGVSVAEGADLYKDKVWLRDVWLPDTQELLTYGVKSHKLFRRIPWDGPEHGPYYTLAFTDVPGNLLPLPPASLWIDLHELANALFRKLARQAEAKKSVVGFAGGNEESVEALKKAKDGEGMRYSGPKPEPMTVGGVDAEILAFFLQTRDIYSYMAGNLDTLGGLAPMSETGVQDRLLSEAASARMERMRAETTDFARKVFKALAWYEWTDPERQRVIHKPVEGTDIVLERVWSEETRDGDFLDFNLDIDPYSMQDDSPAARLQKIGQALERFVFPVLPVLMQQGLQIDFPRLIETISRLANVDELRGMFMFQQPIPGAEVEAGGQSSPTFKPTNTHRTYERINRPGATRHGKDDVMSRILMGAGVQGSEAAAIGRPST